MTLVASQDGKAGTKRKERDEQVRLPTSYDLYKFNADTLDVPKQVKKRMKLEAAAGD